MATSFGELVAKTIGEPAMKSFVVEYEGPSMNPDPDEMKMIIVRYNPNNLSSWQAHTERGKTYCMDDVLALIHAAALAMAETSGVSEDKVYGEMVSAALTVHTDKLIDDYAQEGEKHDRFFDGD